MLDDSLTPPATDAIPIVWQAPAPRSGLLGQWDTFIGPGATRAETWLILGIAGGASLAILVYNWIVFPTWSLVQQVVVLLVAFDLLGGVIANAASPGKRWYHRAGYGFRQRIAFIALHAFHPAVLTLALAPTQWMWFSVIYGYLLIASILILLAPLYLQRALAAGLFAIGVIVGTWLPFPVAGVGWFVPIFYAKLLISYLVREEPYRPARNT